MTWIVGMPSLFGRAFAVSDVRVTWPRAGQSLDCLQKVYPVHRMLAGGFAGSVELGFVLLRDLGMWLATLPQDAIPFPRSVAFKWHRRARWIVEHAPGELRDLGCEIILVGASPTQNRGEAPWARTDVMTLGAPSFRPVIAAPDRCVSIGSGSAIDAYRAALEADPSFLFKGEVGMPGGTGTFLTSRIWFTVRDNPAAAVSRHMLLTSVSRAGVETGPAGWREIGDDGEPIKDPWPPIAEGWDEFCKLAGGHGLAAAGAVG